MTQRAWTRDLRVDTLVVGGSVIKTGLWQYKDQNGGNAIGTKPRSFYPRVKVRPKSHPRVAPLNPGDLALEAIKAEALARQVRIQAYRKRAERRLLPPQAYAMNWYGRNDSPGEFLEGTSVTYRDVQDPWSNLPAGLDPAQEYKLIAKLRSLVYGSGFNPAVFTAEGQQSLRMVGNGASSMALFLGSLAKRDWKGVAAALATPPDHHDRIRKIVNARKGMSDRFLELAFGWIPILSDMEEGGTWLAARCGKTPLSSTLHVSRRWQTYDRASMPSGVWYSQRSTYHLLSLRLSSICVSPVLMPSLATVASVAWEKLPWSFVADWVVPIGSYIESLRTANDIRGTLVRSYRTITGWSDVRYAPNLKFRKWYSHLGRPTKARVVFSRSVSSELNVPMPFDPNTQSRILTWMHAGESLALLSQTVDRIKLGRR